MPETWLYRRLPPNQCKKNSIDAAAFIPRAGEGLSTYRCDMETPLGLLQRVIDDQLVKAASEDDEVRQKAEKMLAQYDSSVEKLIKRGWRVATVPLSAFAKPGLQIVGPDSDGHVDIRGDISIFEQYAEDWVDEAKLLSENDCHNDCLLPTP